MLYEPDLSNLLAIGIAARMGSGASFVRDKIVQCLRTYDYAVEVIKVTKLIEEFRELLPADTLTAIDGRVEGDELVSSAGAAPRRARKFQLLGNALREEFGADILSALCLSHVLLPAVQSAGDDNPRVAYIIDSLKHPAEVDLLRRVLGGAFVMVGVVARDQRRLIRLQERKGYSPEAFHELSALDADEEATHGQHAVKTTLRSDYFFENDFSTKDEIEADAARLMKLVFQIDVVSPTPEEVGMQIAYKASLRSACLSRQVGAAIVGSSGDLLSTGHNDVPMFGGGLYGTRADVPDNRCWSLGAKCYSDERKEMLARQVVDILVQGGIVEDSAEAKDAARMSIKSSDLKNIIEFTRAVHAEMEAIVAIARGGVTGVLGSTMYATTFPCHNCGKHILAAGVHRVVFLEPYEKSLALDLHNDAIESPLDDHASGKLEFANYRGVAPWRFDDMLKPRQERKRHGTFVDLDRTRNSERPRFAVECDVVAARLATIGHRVDQLLPGDEADLANPDEVAEDLANTHGGQSGEDAENG